MNKYRLDIRLSILFVAAIQLGCGSDLASVRGTVEREDSKLTAGKVVFTPIGGGRTAFGEIQPDGTFRLTSESPNDGAAPGKYRLRVIETQITDQGILRTNHIAPPDHAVEVSSGSTNEVAIAIQRADGWTSQQDN